MQETKFFSFILACCFAATGFLFADEIPADSRIASVTVYPDSALLTRTAHLKVTPGSHQIVFSDIIPNLDENTLKVSGAGTARVKILGAQLKKEYLAEKPSERVRQLEEAIEALETEKRKLIDQRDILMQEREFLASLRFFSQGQIPKDLVTKTPSPKDIADLLKVLDENLKANYAGAVEIELHIREVDKKIDVHRRELSEITTQGKIKRFVAVELEAAAGGTLDLNLSYLVYGASWRPLYDARASFDKSEVELVSYGMVKQATGEDWMDVDVTLSTSRPTVGGRMPYVAPWFLRVFQPRPAAVALRKSAKADFRGMSQFAVMDEKMAAAPAGSTAMMEEDKAPQEAEEAYAVSQEKGTGVIYRIPRRATVKANGTEYKLPVGAQLLKSDFKYAAYPKGSPYAYLRTTVENTQDMQLPAGSVNVFLEGDYVSRSSLDNTAPGEKFDLYLGVDENVKVRRELLETKTDDVLVGGIPSPNVKMTFSYKVTLENYKSKSIGVYFFESLPVSEDERIKVKVISVKPEPQVKDWESRRGVWRWETELKPKEKKEIIYSFFVEYPRNLRVEGI